MTVRQLLSSIDSREISEWVAYFNLGQKEKEEAPRKPLDQQFRDALNKRRKKR